MVELNKIYCENCLETMARMDDNSIDCCVTSPPYWGLRDYGNDAQIGLEKTPEEYVSKMVEVFTEVKRVLKPERTLWLNLGDSYAGSGSSNGAAIDENSISYKTGANIANVAKSIRAKVKGLKSKDLVGIPWMVAFALRSSGWYLRQDIIWAKPNPMPESVTDRCTKAHEYVFLLSKSGKYYYDAEAIKEESLTDNWEERQLLDNTLHKTKPTELQNGIRTKSTFGNRNGELNRLHSGKQYTETGKRNKRSVWSITTKPFPEAHFATFPEDLIKPMILAGCPEGGIVYDPFMGAGTTGLVAHKLNRKFMGSELNSDYVAIANKRILPYLNQQKLHFV